MPWEVLHVDFNTPILSNEKILPRTFKGAYKMNHFYILSVLYSQMSVVHPAFIRKEVKRCHLCCDIVLSPCLKEEMITQNALQVWRTEHSCLFHHKFCWITKSNVWKFLFNSPGINICLQILWLILWINGSLRMNVFENKLFLWGNCLRKFCHLLSNSINLYVIWTMF